VAVPSFDWWKYTAMIGGSTQLGLVAVHSHNQWEYTAVTGDITQLLVLTIVHCSD